jgi:hypothetical protein
VFQPTLLTRGFKVTEVFILCLYIDEKEVSGSDTGLCLAYLKKSLHWWEKFKVVAMALVPPICMDT